MRRQHLFLVLIAAVTVSALLVWRSSSGEPGKSAPVSTSVERHTGNGLPLNQVILFNSGVGYFQREGVVEGDARVDMQFPAGDVNDLLKSLVLQDLGQGKIASISYDGQEPIERTLKTFALDLTGNPTFGQLLNQARGEKIELTLQNATGTLTGTIVGMEPLPEAGKGDQLNLLCAEGIRGVPLNTVQRVRFLNAALDSELHRALEVLAGAHNNQKKNVSVQFSGDGKRTVKIGYVVEAPLWKSSYRLSFDKASEPTLQGWAIVENTTEEDWKDVRMALVSSRPISFQMDLYPPLFVPRPVVEPERFASLRPPVYEGPLGNNPLGDGLPAGGMGMAGLGGIGGIAGGGGLGFQQLGGRGQSGNVQGQGNFGGGQQGANNLGLNPNFYQLNNAMQAPGFNKVTYEQMQERRKAREKEREEAKKAGRAIAEIDPTASVNAGALAETVGEQARYAIDHKINLARRRSAMLPLVKQEVAGQRVSIFNDKVHGKFPLRGLKLKNTTGQVLMQGPVSVIENDSYAGDARLPDLQPGEERLVSYAIDQAVEVKVETKSAPETVTLVRVVKGSVEETHKLRTTTKYLVRNRAGQERTLIVEHPINTDWKLVGSEKPAERSRDFYRFEWKSEAGKSLTREVMEERTRAQRYALLGLNSTGIEILARNAAVSPKLREALHKAQEYKNRLSDAAREVVFLRSQFDEVTVEQNRVRVSVEKVPANTPLHKRYLDKLDKLETEIETLQGKMKAAQEKEKKQNAEYVQYLEGLTME